MFPGRNTRSDVDPLIQQETDDAIEDDDVQEERQAIDDTCIRPREDEIRLDHLRKQFLPRGYETSGTVAVEDMCLRIRAGECFALLGTNGAGKSTTLNMLLRVINSTSGSAYVKGVNVTTDTSASNQLFLNFGYCPQSNSLFELMTGEEVIDYFAKIRGIPEEHRASYVQNCISNANLESHAKRRCGKYSGGNKRKLCFATAICGDPEMTVLDESSAGIDPAARKKLWRVLSSMLARGNTVIMTTHHMEEAAKLAHRAAIMVDGRLACLGSPQHLQEVYGLGYELSLTAKENKSVDAVVERVNELAGKECVELERNGKSYIRLGLGKVGESGSFNLADVFELTKESEGELESFALNQSGLEEVFLELTKSRANRGKQLSSNTQGESREGVRLNLPFVPGKGLTRFTTIPADVAAKGVTSAQWNEWVNVRLAKIAQSLSFLNTESGACAICLPLMLPPLSCLICRKHRSAAECFDNLLRDWQRNFNEAVLLRHGMLCKSQSSAF